MDTGKIPFGTEIYLIIKNPLYKGKCPYCGHKNSEADKWVVVEGIYNEIRTDGEELLYYAQYTNPYTRVCEKALINYHYLDNIIDSDYHDENYKPGRFDMYSKDIDIFERGKELDTLAFRTKEDAEEYIKEIG